MTGKITDKKEYFMNKQKFSSLLIILLIFLIASPLYAQRRITVRLASLIPENTPWGAAINRMAADWSRVTNGEVQVVVYHGGTAGDEPEVLRKMNLNEIHAAVFTSMGLSQVLPEVMAISYPFLIRNDAELAEVMRVLRPDLEARIQDARVRDNKFISLAWVNAGWIKFFSKTPVSTPDDLRRLKLATGADNEQMLQAFRIMGYQLIPTRLPDVLSALNSNRIDAIYQSPVYVASGQIFGVARNMTDINVAPFMGGILMNDTMWRRIPERYRPQLMEICRRMERDIESSISSLEAETTATMVRYGLQINHLTPQQMQAWYTDTAAYENRLVSGANPVFNREYYMKIKDILAEYRRGR
jgi:TRAP-type C4-dicarboxylate transport system substrate-binding protein